MSRVCRTAAVLGLVMLMGAAVPARAQQPSPTPGPTMAEALKALETARAAATKIGVNLTCVVADSRGDLVALTRMDNARFFTVDIARGKAMVSAMFGQPSGNLSQFGANSFFANLNATAQARLFPIQGGLPIMKNSQPFGAIACSGGTSQQDEDAARAGLGAFQ